MTLEQAMKKNILNNFSIDDLFQSKDDLEDIRLGDIITTNETFDCSSKTSNNSASTIFKTSLFGYPDDEGIKINGGRIGASLAPDTIRKYLYKMTPSWMQNFEFVDFGNINLNDYNLAQRHENAADLVETQMKQGFFNISLGGGHDYGYPDGKAFISYCKDSNFEKPLIINIDAHMDVRSDKNGLSSGTPFYRLINEFDNEFDLIEYAIQPQCNSNSHINWAKEKGVKVIFLEDIISKGYEKSLNPYLDLLKKNRPTFLSIDIDAFSSSYAMGCSQSWPSGLEPNKFLKFLEFLVIQLSIKNLGIYEVSPPLDLDDRTSKLAAQLIYKAISTQLLKTN